MRNFAIIVCVKNLKNPFGKKRLEGRKFNLIWDHLIVVHMGYNFTFLAGTIFLNSSKVSPPLLSRAIFLKFCSKQSQSMALKLTDLLKSNL
jgi:hypothetical protein